LIKVVARPLRAELVGAPVSNLRSPGFFHDGPGFVAALKAGRPDAYTELFKRHRRRISAVLHRILGADVELDDLVQEVFLRAMGAMQRYRGGAETLEPWLVQIAVFSARNLIRRRRLFRRFFSNSTPPEDALRFLPVAHEHLEAVQRTYAVLSKLPADESVALALCLVDQMPIPEIARACSVSESTIKRRLRRGRKRFETLVLQDPVLRDLSQKQKDEPRRERAFDPGSGD
jgi:RNA polymerase sigma-70 factor (ECF subfamily)